MAVISFLVLIALLSAAAGIFGQAGIEVSGHKHAWRNYYKFLGFTLGQWQTLPPIKGVVLKYFSSLTREQTDTIESLANWNNTASKDEQIIVMLSVAGAQNGIILRTVSLSELSAARAFAEEIAKELRVSVLEFLPVHLT